MTSYYKIANNYTKVNAQVLFRIARFMKIKIKDLLTFIT